MSQSKRDNDARLVIEIRVQPRAGRQGLWKDSSGALRAAVRSAPEGGKANQELVRLVAEWLEVSRSDVEVWRGHKSRQKILRVHGSPPASFAKAIEALDVH